MIMKHASVCRPLCFAALATVFSLAAAPLHAQSKPEREPRLIPSWYVALGGAVSFVEEAHFTVQGGTSPGDGTLNFDTGYGLAGALGYRPRYTETFWDNTRFELEIGLLDNDIESVTSSTGTNTNFGDVQSSRIMANLYLDYDLTKQWRPYLGGGVGIARIHAENDEDTVPAYQGMLGMSYIPSSFPITEFGFGYRYFGTSNPVFTVPGTGEPYEIEYDAHILEFNMRAYF